VTAVTNLQVLDFIFVLVGLSTKKQQKTKMAGPDPKVRSGHAAGFTAAARSFHRHN
jgi:hypothetical protein